MSFIATLEGPDFVVIAMILLVLGAPVVIAIAIIFLLKRREGKPPPIPTGSNIPKE